MYSWKICFPCIQYFTSFAFRKYLFHDVVLKRKFYSPKFVLLVNNAIIHLHPESICFIMYYSKENFIVFFFLVNIVLSPLHQESICFMMSYSKENYIVQNFFSLWTMPYLCLDSILIRYSFHYMIRIFQIESIYDSCIESVTEAICDSYSKHESRSFAHV